jgi:hypothetical protein
MSMMIMIMEGVERHDKPPHGLHCIHDYLVVSTLIRSFIFNENIKSTVSDSNIIAWAATSKDLGCV